MVPDGVPTKLAVHEDGAHFVDAPIGPGHVKLYIKSGLTPPHGHGQLLLSIK